MAIFIASTKSISRGSGQSAVASASYRTGVALEDTRYGKTHDYSKKLGVMSADIILPSALAVANAAIDRCELWNKAEAAEKRVDARVAREWLVNLPHELSEQDRKELAHTFAQTLADRYSTIADCAIHQPTQKEIERGADPRNYHAHIMFTTRSAALDDKNEIVLTDKATIELSDKKRRSLGLERVSEEIKAVRLIWEQIANDKLAQYHHEQIDSRSYAEQGIDIEPQFKMGSVATKLERDAYETAKAEAKNKDEVFTGIDPVTVRGKMNAMIAERNQRVKQRQANKEKVHDTLLEYIADNTKRTRTTAQDVIRATLSIKYATGQIGDNERGIKSRKQYAEYANQLVKYAIGECEGAADSRTKGKSALGHSQSTIDALQRAITDGERNIQSANCHLERATYECDRTARHSERINQYLARPSPFDDNARRARAASRKQKLAELDEQSEQFNYAAERADRDITDHHYHDESANKAVRSIKIKLAMALLNRHHPNSSLQPKSETVDEYPDKFDERQIKSLDEFAAAIGAIRKTRDFKQDCWDSAPLFTPDVVEQHSNLIQILRNPAKEREQYNKSMPETSLSSPQSDLDPLIGDNTRSVSQTSNTATESISESSRRYKP